MLIVADDRPSLREILTTYLASEGFVVRAVADGGQVIELLESGARPALLIVDLHMPICDGSEVVSYVRSRPSYAGLPILLLTGHPGVPEDVAANVQAVLLKPFGLEELAARVRSLLLHQDAS